MLNTSIYFTPPLNQLVDVYAHIMFAVCYCDYYIEYFIVRFFFINIEYSTNCYLSTLRGVIFISSVRPVFFFKKPPRVIKYTFFGSSGNVFHRVYNSGQHR